MDECIFCKISRKEMPTDFISEDDEIISFYDIKPKAPVHILIVPKEHIISIKELSEKDTSLVGKLVQVARNIAEEKGLRGYKLIFNVGREGGQIIDHLHLHLLGGWEEKPGKVDV
jgi:histidine triad (HIT) family protein